MNLRLLTMNEDGPREKLRRNGSEGLSDTELVALVIGTGTGDEDALKTAERLLRDSGGIVRLGRHGTGSLSQMRGIGEAKACRILAAIELGRRAQDRHASRDRQARFTCSADFYHAYRGRLCGLTQEVFLVLGLNNRNQIQTETIVARGTVSECHISPREVFRPLIMEACARMAALHNHPSGDPTPSTHDIALTRRLVGVGEMIGIPVLDHLVVGASGYSSFRDLGMITP